MEMPKTQQEVVRQGYQILVESLGAVDAIRFIQHSNEETSPTLLAW
ncbi:MAG: hypothetical protein HLUCCA11_19320 [Phormidesmis priestleyi Ana]|uniref:Uncharacterized protein n=1 Tax=Phormidesmis priestleyi Ana TaxID=1666911 RepID=A0A0P8BHG8_9CYAN|nr:MAG: hypothetical protein HLUCCA11_19320 [Phormidesmis priestleyi Ana]